MSEAVRRNARHGPARIFRSTNSPLDPLRKRVLGQARGLDPAEIGKGDGSILLDAGGRIEIRAR